MLRGRFLKPIWCTFLVNLNIFFVYYLSVIVSGYKNVFKLLLTLDCPILRSRSSDDNGVWERFLNHVWSIFWLVSRICFRIIIFLSLLDILTALIESDCNSYVKWKVLSTLDYPRHSLPRILRIIEFWMQVVNCRSFWTPASFLLLSAQY